MKNIDRVVQGFAAGIRAFVRFLLPHDVAGGSSESIKQLDGIDIHVAPQFSSAPFSSGGGGLIELIFYGIDERGRSQVLARLMPGDDDEVFGAVGRALLAALPTDARHVVPVAEIDAAAAEDLEAVEMLRMLRRLKGRFASIEDGLDDEEFAEAMQEVDAFLAKVASDA